MYIRMLYYAFLKYIAHARVRVLDHNSAMGIRPLVRCKLFACRRSSSSNVFTRTIDPVRNMPSWKYKL